MYEIARPQQPWKRLKTNFHEDHTTYFDDQTINILIRFVIGFGKIGTRDLKRNQNR